MSKTALFILLFLLVLPISFGEITKKTIYNVSTSSGGGWDITTSVWLYNNSDVLEWNEALGNYTFINDNEDIYINGSIYPETTLTHNIGSGANRWDDLYVANISADAIITLNNITANYFIGSGAYLTNLNVTGDFNYSGDINILGYTLTTSFLAGNVGQMDMRGDPWWLAGTDLEVEQDIIATNFYGNYDWTTADDWNSFNGSVLTFNSSKLAPTYYNVNSTSLGAGTIQGTINLTYHINGDYDGRTFNITESAGSPALNITMNFTNITSFDEGIIRYYTTEIKGEYPIIQLWNYDTNDWEDYPPMASTTTFRTIEESVFDETNHIENGTVQMRMYKSENGNVNNIYYIDWIAIVDGYGVPSPEETDPYSVYRDGSRELTGNWDAGDYNITAQAFNNLYMCYNGSGNVITGNKTLAISLGCSF